MNKKDLIDKKKEYETWEEAFDYWKIATTKEAIDCLLKLLKDSEVKPEDRVAAANVIDRFQTTLAMEHAASRILDRGDGGSDVIDAARRLKRGDN